MWLPKQIGDFVLEGFSNIRLEKQIREILQEHGEPGGLLPDGERHELAAYRFLGTDRASIRMMLRTYNVDGHRLLVISYVEIMNDHEEEFPTLHVVKDLLEKGLLEETPGKKFERLVSKKNESGECHALFSEEDMHQLVGLYW